MNATKRQFDQCRTRYQEQNERGRAVIAEEKYKYDKKITNKIKQAKDNGRKMWQMIDKLK